MEKQNEILEILSDLKIKTSNAAIYLVALLFAIELNSTWLIIVFSCLIVFNLLYRLNNKFKFMFIKHIEK